MMTSRCLRPAAHRLLAPQALVVLASFLCVATAICAAVSAARAETCQLGCPEFPCQLEAARCLLAALGAELLYEEDRALLDDCVN